MSALWKKICGKTKAVALGGATEYRTVGVGSKGILLLVVGEIRLLWTNVGLSLWQRWWLEMKRGDEFVLVSLVFGVSLVVGVLTSVVGDVDGVGSCQLVSGDGQRRCGQFACRGAKRLSW